MLTLKNRPEIGGGASSTVSGSSWRVPNQMKKRSVRYQKFSSISSKWDSHWPAKRLEFTANVIVDACKVTPAKFSGSKEVVPLNFRKLPGSLDGEEIYFDFRKQCFIYSVEKETFCKLPYPSKEPFGYYLKSTGHGTEAKIVAATEKWGRNVFEYPQPTFKKLMKEQCVEPFFVFQVFCVGLWCLDEFWYYRLFTLLMLFMFESTMAKGRLKTLSELRRVRVDSQMLMVYRCGKWVKLSGTELLPGDVVSIGRSIGASGEDKSVPADMLLLAGSAIVNEAILTGESIPQWKVASSFLLSLLG